MRRSAWMGFAVAAVSLPAAAASWHRVPGAPEIELELASLQHQGARVTAWLRMPGRAPALHRSLQEVASAKVSRSAVLTEFDCGRRTQRVLATNAYDVNGTLIFMSSVPQAVEPIAHGSGVVWAYDAVCEMVRVSGRL